MPENNGNINYLLPGLRELRIEAQTISEKIDNKFIYGLDYEASISLNINIDNVNSDVEGYLLLIDFVGKKEYISKIMEKQLEKLYNLARR